MCKPTFTLSFSFSKWIALRIVGLLNVYIIIDESLVSGEPENLPIRSAWLVAALLASCVLPFDHRARHQT